MACTVKDTDQHGRDVAVCQAKGLGDVGSWLVSNGHAVAYRCRLFLSLS